MINILKWIVVEIIILKNFFMRDDKLYAYRVGIIIYAGIGDNLLAAKLISYIRYKYPNSSILIATKQNAEEIYNNNTNIHDLIIFESDSKQKILEKLLQCDRIYSIRTPFWLVLKLMVKYNGCIEFNPLYERMRLITRVRSNLSKKYKKEFYSRIHISNLFVPVYENFTFNENIIKISRLGDSNILSDFEYGNMSYILLHTGGHDQIRKLTSLTIRNLIMESRFLVILVGEKSSENYSDDSNYLDLRGKTNLADLGKLIESALCVVAPDSMVMHMTSITETPLVAIMGNALPETYGPIRSPFRTIILNKSPECAPCSKTTCNKYSGVSCVQSINSKEIIDAIDKIII